MHSLASRIPALATLVALSLGLAACASNTGTAQSAPSSEAASSGDSRFPMTIDNCGQPLTIDKRPEKVLTIGPDPLAQIAAAGAADKVVSYSALLGVELPKLPGLSAAELTDDDPSTEQILSTGADFVIANAFLNTDPETLKKNGITTWTPSSVCDHLVASSASKTKASVADEPIYDKLADDLKTMGALFGTDETAERVVADMKERIDSVAAKKLGKDQSVAILWYFDEQSPIGGIGDGGIINAFTKSLGLKNVFSDQKKAWLEDLSWESILEKDPDVVLVITDMTPGMDFEKTKARLLAEQGADQLKAVKSDSIIHIEYHQGIAAPLSVDGLESLAKQLDK